MRLYTYIIPIDNGSAPNPWGGFCTLNICKPGIRRTAKKGDWVMGTGSKNVKGQGDLSGKCVYLMKVTEVLSMNEYDTWAKKNAPIKIPDFKDKSEPKKRVGDSIYDFSENPPKIRMSVHTEDNRSTDMSGSCTLISNHFIYFGDTPINIPQELNQIVLKGVGHRSNANNDYKDQFLHWAESLFAKYGLNSINGRPQQNLTDMSEEEFKSECNSICKIRKEDGSNDKETD